MTIDGGLLVAIAMLGGAAWFIVSLVVSARKQAGQKERDIGVEAMMRELGWKDE